MDFSSRQPQPQKHLLGIAVVIALHAALIYALVTGLGKKIVDVIKQPIETKVIEEIKPPPPPPERLLPPPPKLEAPPPPFIPPPEVQIATPPPVQNVISATTSTPPAQTDIRPVAPPAIASPPAPPKAAPRTMGRVCPTQVQPEIPRKAIREGRSGSVTVKAMVKGGKIVDIEIVRSDPPRVFDDAVREALMQYHCVEDGPVTQEFVFKLD